MPGELTLFFSLFARFIGFFLLSPLFANKGIPPWARIASAVAISLLLFPPIVALGILKIEFPLLLIVHLIKELAIGYLIGFLFSLLFEAVAFAGEWIGTLSGFSATELLDPLSNTSHPLLSRFFVLTLFALFFSLDLDHPLLRLLYESYTTITPTFSWAVVEATSHLFVHALSYALIPLLLLSFVTLSFALISRFFPALSIFWTGFPLQLLIGIGAIAIAIGYFRELLQKGFMELWSLTQRFIYFSL